tara:strand:+ start:286 stop:1401 length:1116 start_codon:yes stop_codon:yes gene_type:complete
MRRADDKQNLQVHESGSGPGLVLLCGDVSASIANARGTLFAEEGYAVLNLPGSPAPAEVAAAADTLAEKTECTGGPVCIAHGKPIEAALAVAGKFDAVVAFDPDPSAPADTLNRACACPTVWQFGTKDDSDASALVCALRTGLDPSNGSRVYEWHDAAAGFSLPGHPAFDGRVDSLAHSRTLELIRRMVGPHYDYVALFAEHIRHEFETRDVDATMETMISDPYVNHVATLAGGVGHDMLKRFYKYHFVEQNSTDRSSVTVSHTLGPDRVVLELVVRFKHDQMLDRYFPEIEPTQEYVELATVLIVKFRGDKVCHEHIYWDQGSALKQIGVLDTGMLPVAGAEAARKVLDEHLPSNIFMANAWATSAGKPI